MGYVVAFLCVAVVLNILFAILLGSDYRKDK